MRPWAWDAVFRCSASDATPTTTILLVLTGLVALVGLALAVVVSVVAWQFCALCGEVERRDWLED